MDSAAYLETLEASLSHKPEVQAKIRAAREAVSLRLWHELGVSLLDAIQDEHVRVAAHDIHEHVLVKHRHAISPFVYGKLLLVVVLTPLPADSQNSGNNNNNNDNSSNKDSNTVLLAMVDDAIASFSKVKNTSLVAVQGLKCLCCLRALLLMKDEATIEAREVLLQIGEFIETLQTHDLEPVLAALFHKAKLREYELLRDFNAYYTTAFQQHTAFVRAGIPILPDEIALVSYKTVVAALLSPRIFNFGQLLSFEPFVRHLESSSEDEWLLRWARLCNNGDVIGYEKFVNDNKDGCIATIPDLVEALPMLHRKVRLMALLHLVFYTQADRRVFSFEAIAERCQLPLDGVEPLLLAAISNGIIRGKINGVTSTMAVMWVQPRVVSPSEILELAKAVGEWRNKVAEARGLLQRGAPVGE